MNHPPSSKSPLETHPQFRRPSSSTIEAMEDDTDPGQPCATCRRKIQEVSMMTPDGRIVCSRKCAVQGVTLPQGKLDEPTLNLRSPSSRLFAGVRLFAVAWEPRSWTLGASWDRQFVHFHVPMVRMSLGLGEFVRLVRRPHVWLPLCLLSVLAFGVWIGTHWRPDRRELKSGVYLAMTEPTPSDPPKGVTGGDAGSTEAIPSHLSPPSPPSSISTTREPAELGRVALPPPNCAYSFAVDAKGVKRPKVECFEPSKDRF